MGYQRYFVIQLLDPDLREERLSRWNGAFSSLAPQTSNTSRGSISNTSLTDMQSQLMVNRKATLVLEHLLQASDVAHTMQHFQIYQKWNGRLFQELYRSYRMGRGGSTDPAKGWYQGEIYFFESNVIPLAQKLNSCGILGVSGQEYLAYAIRNLREWKARGKLIVQEWKEEAMQVHDDAAIVAATRPPIAPIVPLDNNGPAGVKAQEKGNGMNTSAPQGGNQSHPSNKQSAYSHKPEEEIESFRDEDGQQGHDGSQFKNTGRAPGLP